MGFSIAWLSVPGAAKDKTLAALGLVETTQREEYPESPLVGALLPTGRYVIWFEDASPAAFKPEVLRELSTGTELLACQIEEHAMCSTAAHWDNGVERWFIAHDAEDGLTNLEVIGVPPAAFEPIRIKQFQLQERRSDVDFIFDVPLSLAEAIVGFRHDAAFENEEGGMFRVLSSHGLAPI